MKIFFICGNRDFLLGERYARQCGMTLLPDTQVIEAEGHQILILHGDTLCTDDTDYQHYRQRVHTPWIQRLFLWLPLSLRLKIAKNARGQSICQSAQKRSDYGCESERGDEGIPSVPDPLDDPRPHSPSCGS